MSRLLTILGLIVGFYLSTLPVEAQFYNECQYGFCSPADNGAVTPVSTACSVVSGAVTTFTGQSVGGASPTRISVVSINWGDSTAAGTAELTSVSLGGITMARAVRASGDDQNSNSEIWWLQNPSGTSANIVITASTPIDGITIGVYSLINYLSVAPVSFTTGTTSVSQPYSNKQLALAAGSRTINVSTSLSNMTNDFSSACGPSLWGVHASTTLNGNNQTLVSAISPTSNNPKIALAVWAQAPNVTCNQTGLDFSVNCNSIYVPALIH